MYALVAIWFGFVHSTAIIDVFVNEDDCRAAAHTMHNGNNGVPDSKRIYVCVKYGEKA
jgi:hypothetical protein